MSGLRHHNALAAGYRLHWYRIESVLGQGGFGITYLATDTNLDQPVAIKEFLPSDLAIRTQDSAVHPVSDARSDTFGWGLTRFLTEARTLAQFRHPNIVRVYSVFETNGTAYMVMEYERGTSLEDALKFRYLEGERALVSLVHALMDGLELVHQAGFIHRDIKPDNIFMRANDGVPVLLDFGSARQAVGVETKTLTSLVTPGYAPFEQYNATRDNDRQGPWTDIYSLAATLYRGVTGRGPLDAVARADALLSGNPDPLISLLQMEPSGYSPQLLEAVDAGLAFQPSDRPQSLAEWRTQLPSRPTSPDFTAVARTLQAVSRAGQEDATEVRAEAPSRREATAPGPAAGAPPTAARPAPPREQATSRGGSRTITFVLVAVVMALGGAWAAWTFLGPAGPIRSTGPESVAGGKGVAATSPAPAPATTAPTARPEVSPVVRSTPGTSALPAGGDTAAGLADERQRLEAERRALAAERAKFALEAQKRDMEAARRAAEEREQQIAADRERLDRERRELEALRAADEARVAQAAASAATRAAAAQAGVPAPALAAGSDRSGAGQAVPAPAPDVRTAAAPPREAAPGPASPPGDSQVDEVATLLEAADADLAALRLTSPPGKNAFERYRAVLEMQPDNPRAKAGLARIVTRYLALAQDAAARGDFTRGDTMLARATKVDPTNAQVDEARERLARERTEFEAREAQERQLAEEAAGRERAERQRVREEAAARRETERLETARREAEEKSRAAELAAARAVAEAKAREEDEARKRISLAVFPHDSIRTCFYPVGTRVHDAAVRAAGTSPKVDVVYSFYVRNADASVVGDGGALWQGTAAKKQPRIPAVQAAARTMDADAVLMAWYDCHSVQGYDEDTYRADIYLVDVRTGKLYTSVKGLLDTNKGAAAVLESLYTSRGM